MRGLVEVSTRIRAIVRAAALGSALALGAVEGVASSNAATTTYEPTFSMVRDCSYYADPDWDHQHGLGVFLRGFPPYTPFTGTLDTPYGVTIDAGTGMTTGPTGNWGFSTFLSTVPGIWSAQGETPYGSFQASLEVDCADPSLPPFSTYVFPPFTLGEPDPPPAAPPSDGAPDDPGAPALSVLSTRMPNDVRQLVERGAGGVVSCDRACVVRAGLFLGGSAARRMGLTGKIGQAKVRLAPNERGRPTAIPRRAVARKLLRPAIDGKLRLKLRFTATPPGGRATDRSASWTARARMESSLMRSRRSDSNR
jgi:hypothetical protein